MSKRLRIWCGFADKGSLDPAFGDAIGEVRILKMLSVFSDVFYNGVLVRPASNSFGTGEKLRPPTEHYDLYYLRANKSLFEILPSPKIYMAYPHDERVFSMADGLVVTTDIWGRILRSSELQAANPVFFRKWYPADFSCLKPIIQFKQAIDPDFSIGSAAKHRENPWRYKLTNTEVFGFYGRLDKSSLPYSIINVADLDRRIVLAFAGAIRSDLKSDKHVFARHLYLGTVPLSEMPQLLRATACTLAGESCDDEVLGSNKILDSISLGVPVICKRNPVRDEYLGRDYLGLFDTEREASLLLNRCLGDDEYRLELIAQTKAAATRNEITKAAAFTHEQINDFLTRFHRTASLTGARSF